MDMGACRNLTNQEVKAVAAVLGQGRNPERDRTLFLLGCYAGGRISSLLSLRVRDVIEPDGSPVSTLVFSRANVKRKRKSHYVQLSEECQRILADYLTYLRSVCRMQDDDYLFTTKWGMEPINRVQAYRIINKAAKSILCGGVIGTHSMRKTFAATYHHLARAAYLAGEITEEPLELLRQALGHADLRSTTKYLETCENTVNKFTREISYA